MLASLARQATLEMEEIHSISSLKFFPILTTQISLLFLSQDPLNESRDVDQKFNKKKEIK